MSTVRTSAGIPFRKSSFSMSHLIFVIPLFIPLAGCSNDGAGGPVISTLSTPTDAAAGLDSDQSSNSEPAHHDGDEDPIITMTPTPMGVTAHLTWDPPPDFNVAGYYIYYGKRSPEEPRSEEVSLQETSPEESDSEEPGSCSHGEKQAVDAPPATITGLEPNTQYFFAIRAFKEKESESFCSNEILAVTPPAQS
jgi:fibronectin type III domain protein